MVSSKSAIACARLFVEHTLHTCGAYTLIHEAVRQVDDLVTMAVNATGITEDRSAWTELTRIKYITVRLLGFEECVRIEVWDSAPNPPLLRDEAGSPIKLGSYPTPRGKVVWAELPIYPRRSTFPPRPPAEQFRR
ncbi:MAG: hypothetical protein LC808_40545, partial [Actinobacteria bacterium]|nr:hypothetical protein [Actinomycetota bacterium]